MQSSRQTLSSCFCSFPQGILHRPSPRPPSIPSDSEAEPSGHISLKLPWNLRRPGDILQCLPEMYLPSPSETSQVLLWVRSSHNLWAQYKTKIQDPSFRKEGKVPLKVLKYKAFALFHNFSLDLSCCFLFFVWCAPSDVGTLMAPPQVPATPTLHNLCNSALTHCGHRAPLPLELPCQHVEPGTSPSHGPVLHQQRTGDPQGDCNL